MYGPGDGTTAAGLARGYLRVPDAGREQTVITLKTAFVQGRLARDEFDARIGQALAARTPAELAALTADIPAGIAAARPPRKPMSSAARWGIAGSLTPAMLAIGYAFASQPRESGYGALVFAVAFIYFARWLAVGAGMLWEWHCLCVPGAAMCARCAHCAASHRTSASCAARQGSLTGRCRCACTGYVPPGVSPGSTDSRGRQRAGQHTAPARSPRRAGNAHASWPGVLPGPPGSARLKS